MSNKISFFNRCKHLFCAASIIALSQNVAFAADTVLLNGTIHTVNENQPWAEALVITDGKISFVGDNNTASNMVNENTKVYDLNGKLVLPGLHDVHMHPLEAADPAFGDCNLEVGHGPEAYIPVLQKCAKQYSPTGWVIGWGYYAGDMLDSKRSPLEVIDQAIPDQPALIMGFTSHSYWANSKALELAGIDINTPDPEGGVIVRDPITGMPNGLLLDNAGIVVQAMAMKESEKLSDLAYEGLLGQMVDLPSYGLTSIADARVFWNRGHHKVWQRAADKDELTVRAVLGLWGYPEMDDSQITTLRSLYSNDPNSLLRMSQIKLYSDGIVGTTTAAMKDEYKEGFGWIEGNKGLNYFDQHRISKFIRELAPVGFDFNIHTIGDRGVHEALNAIEDNVKLARIQRHRLTHVEVLDKVDLPRFKKLGVIADFQVAGDWSHPDIFGEEEWLIGDKAHDAIKIRSVYDTGAVVTLSSDYDVSDLNPFVGMQNALTRGKESLPDVASVVEAYTLNGAYTLRQEDRTGSLEKGKFADLIIVDQNIFNIPHNKISKTTVLLTMLGGDVTFKARGF